VQLPQACAVASCSCTMSAAAMLSSPEVTELSGVDWCYSKRVCW
jgi:hypothetical protein